MFDVNYKLIFKPNNKLILHTLLTQTLRLITSQIFNDLFIDDKSVDLPYFDCAF